MIDRRTFLAGVGAAGAVSLMPATNLADDGEPRARRLKKSLKLGMVQVDGSLEDKFRVLKEVGFDGVEPDSPSTLDLDELVAAKKATGLEIPGVIDSVHWGKPLNHPDAAVRREGREGLERALNDAKRLGASTVLLVPAVVNRDLAYDDAYRLSQAEIRRVLPLAEELDVRIALENVWNGFLLSPLEAARYVDELESDAVGWYFDVGNVVNYGWPEQWIRVLGKRVLKLDVKEYSRQKRDDEGLWKGFHVEIGDGDCNWPAVMDALDEVGYTGWASAEVGGGGRDRLAEIAARMDRVLVR